MKKIFLKLGLCVGMGFLLISFVKGDNCDEICSAATSCQRCQNNCASCLALGVSDCTRQCECPTSCTDLNAQCSDCRMQGGGAGGNNAGGNNAGGNNSGGNNSGGNNAGGNNSGGNNSGGNNAGGNNSGGNNTGGGNSSNCPAENAYQSGGRTLCCEYPLENGVCLNCPSNRTYTSNGQTLCCPGVIDDNGNCSAGLSDVGINISTDCLLNGQCSLNVYKVFGIRKQDQNPTVLGFFQDITLASTTAILGTIIIIAIVFSGLLFAFGSITGKDTKRAKTILIDSFVGLLMVMGSYTIIRLIQFLATAGS